MVVIDKANSTSHVITPAYTVTCYIGLHLANNLVVPDSTKLVLRQCRRELRLVVKWPMDYYTAR